MDKAFIHARPVWLSNREKEMNVRAIFRRVLKLEKAEPGGAAAGHIGHL